MLGGDQISFCELLSEVLLLSDVMIFERVKVIRYRVTSHLSCRVAAYKIVMRDDLHTRSFIHTEPRLGSKYPLVNSN